MLKSDSIPSISISGFLKRSVNFILPFDSLLSYKLIGFINILEMRPVPLCIIFSSSITVEPVNKYNPSSPISSTLVLTASHNTGMFCHSSIKRGFSPSKSFEGLKEDNSIYESILSGSCNCSTLFANFLAVVVLPHHFGPTITIAPIIFKRSSMILSRYLGK